MFDLTVLGGLFFGIVSMALRPWWFTLCWIAYLEIGYRCGGSLGKFLLGLGVEGLNRRAHYFRETIGKFASIATFGVGFALILTKDRLALHDYMAKTTVYARPLPFKGSQAVVLLALVAGIAPLSYRTTLLLCQEKAANDSSAVESDFVQRVTKYIAAVGTVYTYGRTGTAIGQGSAVVLTPEGIAATNIHVLDGAFQANCRLGDGRLYEVLAVHAFNASQDIVLFQLGRNIGGKVELPSSLLAVTLGSAALVKVGDRVATISSPKGLSNTVSDGLVSSIRQEGERRLIQTTAPISSGSSGSPLFNTKGEVIGLTTLQMRDGQNLNFAVPIQHVADLLQRRDGLSLPEFQARLAPPLSKPSPIPPRTMRDVFQSANGAFTAGQYAEALKGYERAQELEPTESAAYYNAAQCYVELGDPAKAARMY